MENTELVKVNNNEIKIDENTQLITIKNKNIYSKLIIDKKIRPIFLNNFENIKELEIDGIWYLEERLDKLSFKENIEKLSLKKIALLGIKADKSGYGEINYSLPLPNLKVLELSSSIEKINPNYLSETNLLETLIFNVSSNTRFDSKKKPLKLPSSIKNIIIKTEFNNYNIKLDYIPTRLNKVNFFSTGISLGFYSNYINTKCIIDNNSIYIKNILTSISDENVIDKCLYIPNYITDIKIEEKLALKEIDSISINPKKLELSKIHEYTRIDKFLNNINKIIIRNNDEMKLIPNKELTTNEYGKLISVFIQDKKLQIIFSDYKFIIDELGNIEKIKTNNEEIQIENNENSIDAKQEKNNNLKIYSSNQLEYYSYFKKILELLSGDDKELNDAMNIVEDRLIKKLEIKGSR